MSITIEKGIPLPERAKLPPLPLAEMEIGDSFLIEIKKHNHYTALVQQVQRFQKKHLPKKFSIRKVPATENVRVFRVEDDNQQVESPSISPTVSASESEIVFERKEQSLDHSANTTATAWRETIRLKSKQT